MNYSRPLLIPVESEEEFLSTREFLIERYGVEKVDRFQKRVKITREVKLDRVNNSLPVVAQLDKPSQTTSLKMLVDPEDTLLLGIAPFYRYIYILIAEHGKEKTSDILGVHRMSLWELLSGKYQFNQDLIPIVPEEQE
jgi:hypothetical protein